MSDFKNIIVIGASAGGITAVKKVIAALPGDINAAVFVVIHLSRKSDSKNIAKTFQTKTALKCVVPQNGDPIQKGYLYIAKQDHHLMVKGNTIIINQGAHENKYRPSIDVLFRSAAVNYGNRVIGIILTGMLEDGTSGMSAIKKGGGICLVQEPSEAEFSDMPQSVLNIVPVDYQATLHEIPLIVDDLINRPLPPAQVIPEELKIEANITEQMMTDINHLKQIADRSDFICPDCGGGLWAVKNDPMHRYRCHTGHVYTESILYNEQGEGLEESIWVSLRMLEERRNLLLLMRTHAEDGGNPIISDAHQQRANEMDHHIQRLKRLLTTLTKDLDGLSHK